MTLKHRLDTQTNLACATFDSPDSQSTAALEADVARLLSAFDEVPLAVIEFDAELQLVRCNKAGCEIFAGDQPGYQLGTRNPWIREAAVEALSRGQATTHFSDFEDATGRVRHLILTYLPDVDASGRARRLLVEAIDVTEIRPADSESYRPQFEAAFRQLLGGVIVVRAPDLAVVFLNARARDLLDMEIGQRLGADQEGAEPWHRNELSTSCERALAGEITKGLEVTLPRRDGGVAHAILGTAPIFDSGGRVIAAVGLIVEVTARKRAAQAAAANGPLLRDCPGGDPECIEAVMQERVDSEVREQRSRLSSVVSHVGLGVIITDADGTITEANSAIARLLGYSDGALEGTAYADLAYLDDADSEATQLAALATGSIEGYEHELRLTSRNGSVVWVLVRAALLPVTERTDDAAVLRLVEDLTTQKRRARELKDAQNSVKRAYTDVIAAVTGDRLLLLTEDEITGRLGEVVQPATSVTAPSQLATARAQTRATLQREFPRLAETDALLLACSEALTNAVRHAGGGEFEVRRIGTRAQCVVRDSGRGIDFDRLPKATLVPGYSTMTGSLGAGFTVMLEVCDSVLLSTGARGTTVVLQMAESAPDAASQ